MFFYAGTQIYCSRDCRRAHWEKHRKACLHSRVSVLCRQVLSSCKDDGDTLSHLSILARRGYLTQGRGVVRILFRSPESAEVFVKQGFQRIGECGRLLSNNAIDHLMKLIHSVWNISQAKRLMFDGQS